ncbi:MAG: 4-hydroxy-tetrahydrodipicolinate reductase [Clostridia bacterium]|nr:4-hydroxy-tetrahydrodipicolinate reductase [Clostridia bacterium]
MVNILISGALGRMGRKVFEASKNYGDVKVVAGVDVKEDNLGFPVYSSFSDVKEKADVIIDFSSKSNLDNLLDYAQREKVNAVLCATGYDEKDIKKIEKASKDIALFRSSNMSLGVNILIDLVKKATSLLKGFDIEIVEMHHNKKKDAPSGTALMLADAVKEIDNEKFYVYGRHGLVGERNPDEIGIHALRGGTVVGDHQVIFAGDSETITLSHTATDRSVFANGAIRASVYLKNKKSGLYSMSDIVK